MTPPPAAQTASVSADRSLPSPLPEARPAAIGLSSARLQRASDAFKREVDKGTVPGVTLLVARHGQIGWGGPRAQWGGCPGSGRQRRAADPPIRPDPIFRIFSMTKPIVSLGIMMLVE